MYSQSPIFEAIANFRNERHIFSFMSNDFNEQTHMCLPVIHKQTHIALYKIMMNCQSMGFYEDYLLFWSIDRIKCPFDRLRAGCPPIDLFSLFFQWKSATLPSSPTSTMG